VSLPGHSLGRYDPRQAFYTPPAGAPAWPITGRLPEASSYSSRRSRSGSSWR